VSAETGTIGVQVTPKSVDRTRPEKGPAGLALKLLICPKPATITSGEDVSIARAPIYMDGSWSPLAVHVGWLLSASSVRSR
jgi:hypothetical protein